MKTCNEREIERERERERKREREREKRRFKQQLMRTLRFSKVERKIGTFKMRPQRDGKLEKKERQEEKERNKDIF